MPPYSRIARALPMRRPRGSTSCCPPQTNRPSGRPAAASACRTARHASTTVAETAPTVLIVRPPAPPGSARRWWPAGPAVPEDGEVDAVLDAVVGRRETVPRLREDASAGAAEPHEPRTPVAGVGRDVDQPPLDELGQPLRDRGAGHPERLRDDALAGGSHRVDDHHRGEDRDPHVVRRPQVRVGDPVDERGGLVQRERQALVQVRGISHGVKELTATRTWRQPTGGRSPHRSGAVSARRPTRRRRAPDRGRRTGRRRSRTGRRS